MTSLGISLQRTMLAEGRSRLLLLLLLMLPHNIQAMDGCQRSLFWRCGDVCTSAHEGTKQDCTCGDTKFGPGDSMWCCGTSCTGGCSRWRPGGGTAITPHPTWCAEWSPAKCADGIALHLSQSCKERCNEHLTDKDRNYYSSRSYVAACTNTSTCVKEGEGISSVGTFTPTICTGNSSCEGELTWCKKEERKNETCPSVFTVPFTRCSPTLGGRKEKDSSGTSLIPGQCIDQRRAKDERIYHCLDRTDENPFQEGGNDASQQQQIDVGKLKSCTDEQGGPGLECDEKGINKNCIAMRYWCKDWDTKECPVLGAGILTNNLEVCQEYGLWRDKPCYWSQIRCRAGSSGQCVGRSFWGTDGALDDNRREAFCKDGSSLYRPIVKAEELGLQPLQEQVWKTRSFTESIFNWYFKGKEEAAKYRKDSTTGLWMVAVSEKICEANDGFVCKVKFDAMTRMMMILKICMDDLIN